MADIVQINISMSDDDARMLDRLMEEDFFDNRSAYVRKLIRQEWARRYSRPNPAVTIEQAANAAKGPQ